MKLIEKSTIVVTHHKMTYAQRNFEQFLSLYDPLEILNVSKPEFRIYTKEGEFIFTNNEICNKRGYRYMIEITDIYFGEFMSTYARKWNNKISNMTILQKHIYNLRLWIHLLIHKKLRKMGFETFYL